MLLENKQLEKKILDIQWEITKVSEYFYEIFKNEIDNFKEDLGDNTKVDTTVILDYLRGVPVRINKKTFKLDVPVLDQKMYNLLHMIFTKDFDDIICF